MMSVSEVDNVMREHVNISEVEGSLKDGGVRVHGVCA